MAIEEDFEMGYDIPQQVPDDLIDLNEAEKKIIESEESMESLTQEYTYIELLEKSPKDKGLIAYGLMRGYLQASTALETMSIEAAVEVVEGAAKEATTGLYASLKEKLGGWLAKIGPTLKATGKAILDFITRQWDKLTTLVGKSGNSVKETVVAHPFATLLAAVTACLGLGAAAPALMRFAPGVLAGGGRMQVASAVEASVAASHEAAAATGRMNTIVSKLSSPFKKFSFVAKEGKVVLKSTPVSAAPKAVSGNASKLGWTKQSVSALMTKLSGVKQFAPKLSQMAADLYHAEVKEISTLWKNKQHLKFAGNIGWKAFLYVPFITLGWQIIKAVFGLIKAVIWGTFSLVTHTFKALFGSSSSDTTQPPTEKETHNAA